MCRELSNLTNVENLLQEELEMSNISFGYMSSFEDGSNDSEDNDSDGKSNESMSVEGPSSSQITDSGNDHNSVTTKERERINSIHYTIMPCILD